MNLRTPADLDEKSETDDTSIGRTGADEPDEVVAVELPSAQIEASVPSWNWQRWAGTFSFAGPIIALALGIKVLVYVVGVFAAEILGDRGFDGVSSWFSLWNTWDAPHYLSIAQHNYQSTGDDRVFIVFLPGYPMLVRTVAPVVGGNYLLASFLVAGAASISAALLLGYLVRADSDDEALATRAVWFFLIFPTAYFLHLPYTESLFLTFVLGSVFAARQDRWLIAGAVGGLAAMTRINGLILIPTLAMEAISQFREHRRLRLQWLWMLLVALGFGVYLYVNWRVFGHAFEFLKIQKQQWFKELEWPWTAVTNKWNSLDGMTKSGDRQMVVYQELLYLGIGAVATVASWIWLRPLYGVWMTGNLLLFASTSFILSTPRYVLTLFPIFMLLAKLGRNQTAGRIVSACSISLMMLFTASFAMGRWTF